MIKHVILWKIRSGYTDAERAEIIRGAKQALEDLQEKIPGLLSIRVIADALPSSNADLMLDSAFESSEALKNYQAHPAHMAAADQFVRPYMESRLCLDFEEK